MIELVPTFEIKDFLFEESVPEHVEGVPTDVFAENGFSLFSDPPVNKCRLLAVDIPNKMILGRLIVARINLQIPTVKLRGQSDDIYILTPEGEQLRVYEGWANPVHPFAGGANSRILPD